MCPEEWGQQPWGPSGGPQSSFWKLRARPPVPGLGETLPRRFSEHLPLPPARWHLPAVLALTGSRDVQCRSPREFRPRAAMLLSPVTAGWMSGLFTGPSEPSQGPGTRTPPRPSHGPLGGLRRTLCSRLTGVARAQLVATVRLLGLSGATQMPSDSLPLNLPPSTDVGPPAAPWGARASPPARQPPLSPCQLLRGVHLLHAPCPPRRPPCRGPGRTPAPPDPSPCLLALSPSQAPRHSQQGGPQRHSGFSWRWGRVSHPPIKCGTFPGPRRLWSNSTVCNAARDRYL